MSAQGFLQLFVLLAALVATVPALSRYMARVYALDGAPAPGDRWFAPVERVVYRLLGVDEEREQRWNVYAVSLLAFSAVGLLVSYAVLRIQGSLPLDPTGRRGVAPLGAWNAAVSFVTNTNWQWFSGEVVISHLTQMIVFTVQNFVSAAVGMCVAIALIRGIARRRSHTLGNFWVDLVRTTTRILLPIALIAALAFVALGVVQNLGGDTIASTVDPAATASSQVIPGGPVASQLSIRDLGTNGGGFFNTNAAHPFENPNGWTNLLAMYLMVVIPFALALTFGRLVGRPKQGRVLLSVMVLLLVVPLVVAAFAESAGTPELTSVGVDQGLSSLQSGGNMEGKDIRFGPASCATYGVLTTGTSTGSVNCMHDSMTPAGGAMPMISMLLGEVSPGGVGAGLTGILINALLAVFIAGLMVGRTPELLGKKIQAAEMKLVVLYIVATPVAVLVGAAVSVVLPTAVTSILNPGPHGLSEVLYNYASTGNNNGSAFAGMSAGTDWFTVTQGFSMLVGRFFLIIPALALGASLARKRVTPVTAGTFPTDTPLFAGLVVGVIVVVAGLTYFPALALGPIVETLSSGVH